MELSGIHWLCVSINPINDPAYFYLYFQIQIFMLGMLIEYRQSALQT